MDASFLPIDAQTVTIDTIKPFDVFFSANGKMSMYSAGGEQLHDGVDKDSAEAEKGSFYILKKDAAYYQLYLEEVLGTLLENPGINGNVKARTAYHAILNIAKSLFTNPDEKFMRRYRVVIRDTVDYILRDDNALRLLINLTNFDYSVLNHSVNVGIFSVGLAKEIFKDRDKHDFGEIGIAMFLHDIGKTAIPIEILNKKGPLSNLDWKFVKRHPEEGLRILDGMDMLTREAEAIVGQHHERLDGSGYPKGLRGDQIHMYSQICAVADTFDGMTSKRPYRKEYTTFNAMKIMKHEVFKDFPPLFFTTFIKMLSSNPVTTPTATVQAAE